MKRFIAILFTLMTIVCSNAFSTENDGPVYIVPLKGPIDQPQFYIIRRAFREAESNKAKAVIIEMDTPGGGLRETEEMLSWMRSFSGDVYSFVTKHAQSAGAILCLGSDKIYMAPGSRIGSATPVLGTVSGGVQEIPSAMKEKIMSDTRSLVRGLAQENGYPEKLAVAMVDPEYEYKNLDEIISPKGELLNLTAHEAANLKDAEGNPVFVTSIVSSAEEILEDNSIAYSEVKRFQVSAAESFAKWITMLSPLFLLIGIAGVYIEIKTPGFGIPGITGGIFLCIFFFGHYVAGLAGKEELVIIGLGIILLALEIFVIPGFGVTGITGILLIILGGFAMMLPIIPAEGFSGITNLNQEYLKEALWKFSIFLLLFLTTIWLLAKFLPKTGIFSRLVLDETTAKGKTYSEPEEENNNFLNQFGKTLTALRPVGTAILNGKRTDVVSHGPVIEANQQVKVIKVVGNKIIVKLSTEGKDEE